MKRGIGRGAGSLFLAAALLFMGGHIERFAQATSQPVKIYTFSVDSIPPELLQTAMQVCEEDVTFTLTFAGDCTLGGTEAANRLANGFARTVEERGAAYPFEKLQPLFAGDDCTIVNLEGVLSGGKPEKVKGKQYHFIGSPAYTDILRLGSVECVNVANNHTLDYGEEGYRDTLAALHAVGIAHFGETSVTVVEKGGVRIGFTGNLFNLAGERMAQLARQVEALERVGCLWIAHSMHAGVEYSLVPSPRQRAMAEQLSQRGMGMVVGHHPHVVQGVERFGDMPVVYSLGNCSFGGSFNPRDYDACVLRASIRFVNGKRQSLTLALHPIRISGDLRRNDFQPFPLTGADAQRVLDKMQKSSPEALAPFREGHGAVLPEIVYALSGEGPARE